MIRKIIITFILAPISYILLAISYLLLFLQKLVDALLGIFIKLGKGLEDQKASLADWPLTALVNLKRGIFCREGSVK
jgi:hypothetical protein